MRGLKKTQEEVKETEENELWGMVQQVSGQ